MRDHQWARLLAYVTGLVNQRLLVHNEYLAAETRLLRAHLQARLRLSDPERCALAEIGKRLGRKALQEVAVLPNKKDSGLVPPTHCSKVRWIEEAIVPRPAAVPLYKLRPKTCSLKPAVRSGPN